MGDVAASDAGVTKPAAVPVFVAEGVSDGQLVPEEKLVAAVQVTDSELVAPPERVIAL